MNQFISNYIKTLNPTRQRKASTILDSLKIEKANLSYIADKLKTFGLNAMLTITPEDKYGRISGGKNSLSFRDVQTRMKNLYDESNTISALLDGNADSLISDIKSLESEVTALEKALSNYAFLLSDGGTYDYAFLEPFSDERNKESFDFNIPDRGGVQFSDIENAAVDTQEGTLGIIDTIQVGYPLTGNIVNTNAGAYRTSDSGIQFAVTNELHNGWRVSITSPRAIQATLPDFKGLYNKNDWVGVQYVVEFAIDKPSPVDTIRISPFADFPFELTQVYLYPTKQNDKYTTVLDAPIVLDHLVGINFQLQSVQRIRLFLRQETFQVNTASVNSIEDINKSIIESVGQQTSDIQTGLWDPENTFRNNNFIKDWEVNSSIAQVWLNKGFSNKSREVQNYTPIARETLDQVGRYLLNPISPGFVPLPTYGNNIINPAVSSDVNADTPKISIPSDPNLKYTTTTPATFGDFKYNLGLQSIKVGVGAKGYKGVFVSKSIPAPGDMGEVKIKTSENNYNYSGTDRDLPLATFIEYSVTNKSTPSSESDWIPILPIDFVGSVRELILLNEVGAGLLRFPADIGFSLTLYKNGYRISRNLNDLLIKSEDKQAILGLRLPQGFVNSSDSLICEYTPVSDSKIVNFEAAGFDLPPLVSSHDSSGPGEGFLSSGSNLTINLRFAPFIDYSQVDSAVYDSVLGLNPYNPITVTLEDGTNVINLTNYKGGSQTVLNADAVDYQFIQSQNVLLFNKVIDQPFKVYYQYLPNNVRFRVILRSCIGSFVSPKVDWIQVKGKTRKADPKRA